MTINPVISLLTAWRMMNMLNTDNCPIPFKVMGIYCTTNEKDPNFGKVITLENVIMARNGKYLGGEYESGYNPAESEIIYARDWLFLLPDGLVHKSLSHWHITHINDMEVNFPKTLS